MRELGHCVLVSLYFAGFVWTGKRRSTFCQDGAAVALLKTNFWCSLLRVKGVSHFISFHFQCH